MNCLETLTLAGHSFVIERPVNQDHLLQQALEAEAAGREDWDPYWGLLWAASPKTAECILKAAWPPALKAMELGCGIGLTGIAALKAGMEVTFSDQASDAVTMAQSNAVRNGFANSRGLVFRWHRPPDEQFDFLFASDVLYDIHGHQPLLQTIDHLLSADGQVWIGDAGRIHAPAFVDAAQAAGWNVLLSDENGLRLNRIHHMTFCLIQLTRNQPSP